MRESHGSAGPSVPQPGEQVNLRQTPGRSASLVVEFKRKLYCPFRRTPSVPQPGSEKLGRRSVPSNRCVHMYGKTKNYCFLGYLVLERLSIVQSPTTGTGDLKERKCELTTFDFSAVDDDAMSSCDRLNSVAPPSPSLSICSAPPLMEVRQQRYGN